MRTRFVNRAVAAMLAAGLALALLLPLTAAAAPALPAAGFGPEFLVRCEAFMSNARYMLFAPGVTDPVFADANVLAADDLYARAAEMVAFLQGLPRADLSGEARSKLELLCSSGSRMLDSIAVVVRFRHDARDAAAMGVDAGLLASSEPVATGGSPEDNCASFVKKFKMDLGSTVEDT